MTKALYKIIGLSAALIMMVCGGMVLVSRSSGVGANATAGATEIEIRSVVIADRVWDGTTDAGVVGLIEFWTVVADECDCGEDDCIGPKSEPIRLFVEGWTSVIECGYCDYNDYDACADCQPFVGDYTVTAQFVSSGIGNNIDVIVTVTLTDSPNSRGLVLNQNTFVATGNILHIPTAEYSGFSELQMNVLHIRMGARLGDTGLPNGWQWQNPDMVIGRDTDTAIAVWVPANGNYATAFREIALRVDTAPNPLIIASIAILAAAVLALITVIMVTRKKHSKGRQAAAPVKGDAAEKNFAKYME